MEYVVEPSIGYLVLELQVPQSQSLKDKRAISQRIRARLRSKFNVSVAELRPLDKWQTLFIGVALIGDDPVFLQKVLDEVVDLVSGNASIVLLRTQQEFL